MDEKDGLSLNDKAFIGKDKHIIAALSYMQRRGGNNNWRLMQERERERRGGGGGGGLY